MYSYERLLQENKAWAAEKLKADPEYFDRLSHIQTPEFLWIGCSDSRVPANEITGTQPRCKLVECIGLCRESFKSETYNCLRALWLWRCKSRYNKNRLQVFTEYVAAYYKRYIPHSSCNIGYYKR